MEEATSFCGLAGMNEEVSVAIQELPAPLAEILPAMKPAKLESRGMFLLGQESKTIAGAAGLLLHVSQPRGDDTFVKWIGVTGDERRTILITAAFPQPAAATWSSALREIVLSAELAGDDAAHAVSSSLGSVQPAPPFLLGCRLMDEVIYTPGGVFPLPRPTDPLFTLARGSAAVLPEDRAAYAEQRAHRLEVGAELEVESRSPVEIGGLPGIELMGHAPARPQPLFVFQTMLFAPTAYDLLVGLCPLDVRQRFEPIFRQMTATFQRGAAT
jgi:hypothetical protein